MITFTIDKKYLKISIELLNSLKSKQHLLDLKLENILAGDLFYDEYLASKSKSTINLDDQDFKDFLEAVSLFYYWYDFYLKNKVNAVILSHSVYFRLSGRIAIFYNIPVIK